MDSLGGFCPPGSLGASVWETPGKEWLGKEWFRPAGIQSWEAGKLIFLLFDFKLFTVKTFVVMRDWGLNIRKLSANVYSLSKSPSAFILPHILREMLQSLTSYLSPECICSWLEIPSIRSVFVRGQLTIDIQCWCLSNIFRFGKETAGIKCLVQVEAFTCPVKDNCECCLVFFLPLCGSQGWNWRHPSWWLYSQSHLVGPILDFWMGASVYLEIHLAILTGHWVLGSVVSNPQCWGSRGARSCPDFL